MTKGKIDETGPGVGGQWQDLPKVFQALFNLSEL